MFRVQIAVAFKNLLQALLEHVFMRIEEVELRFDNHADDCCIKPVGRHAKRLTIVDDGIAQALPVCGWAQRDALAIAVERGEHARKPHDILFGHVVFPYGVIEHEMAGQATLFTSHSTGRPAPSSANPFEESVSGTTPR